MRVVELRAGSWGKQVKDENSLRQVGIVMWETWVKLKGGIQPKGQKSREKIRFREGGFECRQAMGDRGKED